VVEQDTYEGKTNARVRWINRPGGQGIKLKAPLEGAELEAFSARMSAKAAAVQRFDVVEVPDDIEDLGGSAEDDPGVQSENPDGLPF